MHSEVESN